MDGGVQLFSLLWVERCLGPPAIHPRLACYISVKIHAIHVPFTSLVTSYWSKGTKVQASKWQPVQSALHCGSWLLLPIPRLTNTKTWVAFLPWTHGWGTATNDDLECLLSLGELDNAQGLSTDLCKHTLNSGEENVCSFLEPLSGALWVLTQAKEFG